MQEEVSAESVSQRLAHDDGSNAEARSHLKIDRSATDSESADSANLGSINPSGVLVTPNTQATESNADMDSGAVQDQAPASLKEQEIYIDENGNLISGAN